MTSSDQPGSDRPGTDRPGTGPSEASEPGSHRAADEPHAAAEPDSLPDTVAKLAGDELDKAERRQLMGRLVGQTAARTTGGGRLPRPGAILNAVIEALSEVAERLPIRDFATLRTHHPGLSDEELATRLVRNASRATAAVGAAGGGVAAVEWTMPPTLLTAPVLLTAETVAVAAIELKLIGELHEVYRTPVRGSAVQRATALLTAWASRRGVNPLTPGRGMGAVLSTAARNELRDRLLRRFGRNLTTLGPLLTGAAVGAELNRRATRAVGDEIRQDLRRRVGGRAVQGTVTPPPLP